MTIRVAPTLPQKARDENGVAAISYNRQISNSRS